MINIINGLLMELNNIGKVFFNYASGIFIQTAILVAVLFIIDLLLRKRIRAVIRYCIWLLVLVKLILPPTLSLPTGIAYWAPNRAIVKNPILEHSSPFVGFEQLTQETFPNLQPSDVHIPPANPVESDSIIEPLPVSLVPITWQATVLLFWLVGMLAFAALLAKRVRFVRGLVTLSTPAEGQLLRQLEECRLHMRLLWKVTLRTSDALSSVKS